MIDNKTAAIWCRVSTDDQRELSLDSQEEAVMDKLKSAGYTVPAEYVIKVAWTSLDLMSCPEFQRLCRLVAVGKLQAVGTFDRDRLQAQGLQRLTFIADCQDNGVEIITAQGAEMVEGGEGQLIELALALGKERSVRRAQQGARDGLRDRARLKGLPAVPVNFFGYTFDRRQERFVPNERYDDVCEIWRMGLEGNSIGSIATELTRRGIPTPAGKPVWYPSSVRNVLRNRAYAGVIEALKTVAIAPKRRAGNTYGKSTNRPRPEDERIRLAGLVDRPVVSEEEFNWMRQRLLKNKQFASKNSKRQYLFSGMIECGLCGHSYVGFSQRGRHAYYRCTRRYAPVGAGERCSSPNMRAVDVEDRAYEMACEFLAGPEGFGAEMSRRSEVAQVTAASVQNEIAGLERQDRQARDSEAAAFRLVMKGTLSEDVFEQEAGLLRTRRKWISEQRDRLIGELEDLERYSVQPVTIEMLRKRLESRLTTGKFQDRRFVLEALGAKIIVQAGGHWELELRVPKLDPELQPEPALLVNKTPGI